MILAPLLPGRLPSRHLLKQLHGLGPCCMAFHHTEGPDICSDALPCSRAGTASAKLHQKIYGPALGLCPLCSGLHLSRYPAWQCFRLQIAIVHQMVRCMVHLNSLGI